MNKIVETGKKTTGSGQEYVSVSRAAQILGVSIDTVRRWEKAGKITAKRLDGKNRSFALKEIERFAATQSLSTTDVAKLLKISPSSVRRLEDNGQLKPVRAENGRRGYTTDSVERYQEKQREIAETKKAAKAMRRATQIVAATAVIAAEEMEDAKAKPEAVIAVEKPAEPAESKANEEAQNDSPAKFEKALETAKATEVVAASAHIEHAEEDQLRGFALWGSLAAIIVSLAFGFFIFTGFFNKTGEKKASASAQTVSGSTLVSGTVDGDKIADGAITIDKLSPEITSYIKKIVGESGKDGAAGKDGKDGANGVSGADGKNGKNGKDGVNTVSTAGTITSIIAGLGLSGGGTAGSVSLDIATGDSMKIIGGALEVALDGTGTPTSTTTSKSGLEVTADGLRLMGGCSDGQILKWDGIGNQWVCAADATNGVGGTLTVSEGGTGRINFTANGVLFGNGGGALQITTAGTAGQLLLANGSGTPTFTTVSGDMSISGLGVASINANAVDLGTDTVGNYVASLGTLTGLNSTGNTGEGSTPTLAVTYGSTANTSVEGDTTLTCTAGTGNITGGGNTITLGAGGTCGALSLNTSALDSDYVNTSESPTAGDISGSFAAGLVINSDAVALGSNTTGNYVASFTAGNGLTGDATGEGSTSTLNIVSANGGIQVGSDNIALTLQTSGDALSSTNASGSGMEVLSGGLALLQGCTDGQILKWNESTDVWYCANDLSGGGGLGNGNYGDIDVSGGGSTWTIANDAVALGTQTTGDYVANLGTLVGLDTTGNSGEGSTPGLSVKYGSAASTAVQGNVTITCPTGSGGITGGGDTITLGAGGTCSGLSLDYSTIDSHYVKPSDALPTGHDISGSYAAGFDINANAVALGADTTGSYVQSFTAGNGLTGDASGEGSTPTLNIVSANGGITVAADSIALTLQASGDALSSTNSNGSGMEVTAGGLTLLQGCTDGQILKWNETTDVWYCAADNAGSAGIGDGDLGDITVSGGGSIWTIDADAIALGADTTGNYIAGVTAGAGLTGDESSEGGTANLAIGSANGGIAVNADDIALTLQSSSDDLSNKTSSGSGMEILSGGLTLLQGCGDGQILKWNETADVWYCGDDNDTITPAPNGFGTIGTPSGTNPAATSPTDTLSLAVSGSNLAITGNSSNNTITFNIDEATLAGNGLGSSGSALQINTGNGIQVSADNVALGPLTADWDQTGPYDIVLDNSGSELVMRDSDSTNYGTFDVGNLSADATYTFRGASGTVLTDANYASTLTGVYLDSSSSPLAGDISGSFGSGFTIGSDAVALGNDTTGNYVRSIAAGAGLTGDVNGEGTDSTLAIGSANGGIKVNADDIALTLQTSADGLSSSTSSGSGLEILAGGLSLLQGCSDNQVLKWNESFDIWGCANDVDTNTESNGFSTFSAPTGTDPVADSATDTLSLAVTGTNLAITGSSSTDTVTFDISEATLAGNGLGSSGDALTVNTGNGIQVSSDNVALGPLTANWNQTGAFDIYLNNSGSELVIRDSDGTNNGTLDVGDLSGDATYMFSGNSGIVLTDANYASTLDSVYVNNADTPTAGDISGSFSGGLFVGANSVALGTDTTGNYVAGFTAGNGLTGDASGEGSSPTLAIGSANGGIKVNADDIALTLQTSADGLSSTTSSGSGLEVLSGGLSLLQGCGDSQVLKWNETTDTWTCSNDTDTNSFGFSTFSAPSGTDPVADSITDTLSLAVTGTNLAITGSSSTDTVTFDISEATLAGNGLGSSGDALVVNAGSGIQVSGDNVTLGPLTSDWNQTGAFDIYLNNSASELKIRDSDGTNDGKLDVGDLGADATYTFGGTSGLVLTDANYAATLDSVYVNSGEAPAAGDITGNFGAGLTVGADAVALGTDTTGNYVATISAGNGISGSSSSEGGSASIGLGNLTGDWTQTGAFDIYLNNSASELKIRDSDNTNFGMFDVGNLSTDATFTFSGASGLVFTDTNYASTLDGVYVNTGENPAAGDITGSFTAGLNVSANSVALTTDTTGNYVASITAGAGLTGDINSEGGAASLAVASANAGIAVNADNIALTLQGATAGASSTTSSGSGLEITSGGLTMLQGCANSEVLKWDDTNNLWKCGSSTYSKFISTASTNVVNDTGNTATQAMTSVDVTAQTAANATEVLVQYSLDYTTETASSGWHLHIGPTGSSNSLDNVVAFLADDDLTTGVTSDGGEAIIELDAGQTFTYGLTETAGTSTVAARINVIGYWAPVTTGADLAENYYTSDSSLQPGDVVALDPSLAGGVKKAKGRYDPNAIGVISTQPGIVLDDVFDPNKGTNVLSKELQGRHPVAVALAGRIPVNVSTENGPIKAGDYLTPSSTPGIAMKATKAGQVLGQALFDYDHAGIGAVMMFVKNTTSNGSGFMQTLQSDGEQSQGVDYGQAALNYFMQHADDMTDVADMSEIYTDRVAAGLEVVTPKLTADEIDVNKIKIGDQGISFTNSQGQTVAVLDANGNFQATSFTTGTPTTSGGDGNGNSNSAHTAAVIDGNGGLAVVNDEDKVLNNLTVNLDLLANGSLKVEGPAEFKGTTLFDQVATFGDSLIVNGDATFKGTVTFNSSAGGYATVAAGQTTVHVTYDKAYANTPVVTLTLGGGKFAQYSYTNSTATGFDIILDQPATSDLKFSWAALSVAGN